jgi:hypothetical protein
MKLAIPLLIAAIVVCCSSSGEDCDPSDFKDYVETRDDIFPYKCTCATRWFIGKRGGNYVHCTLQGSYSVTIDNILGTTPSGVHTLKTRVPQGYSGVAKYP